MAIPNTTPTPNELFNGEMRNMTDSELRVVMMVTRATFGWILDKERGLRKEEDWISHSQMIEKSGKSSRAISYAVSSCIKNNWIEARTEDGKLLDTPEKRKSYGRKIFYRLGSKFLPRAQTIANDAMAGQADHRNRCEPTIANNDTEPSQPLRTTKENITKATITKGYAETSSADQKLIADIIFAFKDVNPTYKRLFGMPPQRKATERLLAQFGEEKLRKIIAFLPKSNGTKYAPTITTPVQLEQKMGELIAFVQKERSASKNTIGIAL